jgi:GNAT superfamily N-acetyltransferase
MPSKSVPLTRLEFHPVTPDRWTFENLFERARWMLVMWRLKRLSSSAGRTAALKKLIATGQVPGLLAYAEGEPVGWCSVAPRHNFPALERSRILKPVDDQPVWSVVCFFVARPFRRKGVTHQLLTAAIEYARDKGAKIIEGYPVEPKTGSVPDVFVFTGLASAFRKAGFVQVARRSETRPIMRYTIQ